MKLHIYDANNYLRRAFEAGRPVQQVVPFYASGEPRLWVFDGKGALTARRALYPGYKVKRDRETPTINGAYDFIRAVEQELLPHCDPLNVIIRIDGMEADDVIATLARQYTGLMEVCIWSNDGDFLALEDLEGVRLMERPKLASVVTGADVRLYKTLVGDSSDNIPGLKLFGGKAWASLTYSTKLEWQTFLEGDDIAVNFLRATMKPAQSTWFLDSDNRELMRTYWKVVGFLPVDQGLINRSTIRSRLDREKYQETCKKYMWGWV